MWLVFVAMVAFSGTGIAHLTHAASSPVPALMMILPVPRQCGQVLVVFMWCFWLDHHGISSDESSCTGVAYATLRGAVACFIGAPCASDGK